MDNSGAMWQISIEGSKVRVVHSTPTEVSWVIQPCARTPSGVYEEWTVISDMLSLYLGHVQPLFPESHVASQTLSRKGESGELPYILHATTHSNWDGG